MLSNVGVEKKPYERYEANFWKLTIGLTLASLLNFANLYVVQPLLPVFAREFSLTPTMSSFAMSLTTLSLVIGLLFFGFLSDHIGRIGIIQWTLCLSVVPLLVIPLVDSYLWILMWRFITGFGIAGLPAVAIAYINEEIARSSRGLIVTIYIASNALGGMLGRFVSGYFADHYSWEVGFYVIGVFGAFICFGCFLLLPKSRFFVQYNRTLKEDFLGMLVHLKNQKLAFAFLFGMMIQFGFTGIWTYIPFYLEQEPFYLSIHLISLVYFTYLFGVFGSPFAGRLAAKYNILHLMFFGLITMVIGVWITTLQTVAFVVLGLSIVCFGFFIAHSLTSAWIGETATHHKSGASSFYFFSYYIGVTVGGTAVGEIWSTFHWIGVVVVCSILPAVFGALFFIVAKKV
ncbi:MFS transporter [Salirhabdus sp. Marseille-P4669]|uniref:MFS transporter n=1 Tax=Salirhabdus sp. Marseille-P4669 TaxID=2042310 RepID=UPI0013571A04|nr:MFS transporter [Salirhabdus sp. Marseille-P4669]